MNEYAKHVYFPRICRMGNKKLRGMTTASLHSTIGGNNGGK